MVSRLVAAYNAQPRDVDGSCVTVVATKDKSGLAAEDATHNFSHLPEDHRPTVWVPDASSWIPFVQGRPWESALTEIRSTYGHYAWVHVVNNAALITAGLLWSKGDNVVNNAALITAGLLWSKGDYAAAVGNTVQGGWDTDSNGATVGSVMGALLGAERLPQQVIEPLQDRTRSAVFGYDHSRISALAQRTAEVCGRLN